MATEIDIGTVVQDMIVEEQAYGQPSAWFLNCGHGHRIFATNKMIDGGVKLFCTECQREAMAKAEAAQLSIDLRKALHTNMF